MCTLFDVKVVTKEQFLKFSPITKYKFIGTQKTLFWINLLDKSELIEFLNFHNVHCANEATFLELRNLAIASLKRLRAEDISNDDTNLIIPHFEENENSLLDLTFIDSDQLPSTSNQPTLIDFKDLPIKTDINIPNTYDDKLNLDSTKTNIINISNSYDLDTSQILNKGRKKLFKMATFTP